MPKLNEKQLLKIKIAEMRAGNDSSLLRAEIRRLIASLYMKHKISLRSANYFYNKIK